MITTTHDARESRRPAAIPISDLLPFQQVPRDETETRVISPEPRIEPWPQATEEILSELIAYHRLRAHRWRARVVRRALRRMWRWSLRRRSRESGSP